MFNSKMNQLVSLTVTVTVALPKTWEGCDGMEEKVEWEKGRIGWEKGR